MRSEEIETSVFMWERAWYWDYFAVWEKMVYSDGGPTVGYPHGKRLRVAFILRDGKKKNFAPTETPHLIKIEIETNFSLSANKRKILFDFG